MASVVKDELSREQFVEKNLPLVHALCRRFVGRGIEYDDLFGAGCVGLVKATDAFDASRGLCFSTYAVPVILGEIKRLFRDGGAIKVSRSLKELSYKVTRAAENLSLSLGRQPTVGEIAVSLSVDVESVTQALDASHAVISLTGHDEDGDREMDLPTETLEESLDARLLLSGALKGLEARDKQIVSCRYFHGLTQSKTADLLGMSQVQVSRAEKKILTKLRADIGA